MSCHYQVWSHSVLTIVEHELFFSNNDLNILHILLLLLLCIKRHVSLKGASCDDNCSFGTKPLRLFGILCDSMASQFPIYFLPLFCACSTVASFWFSPSHIKFLIYVLFLPYLFCSIVDA